MESVLLTLKPNKQNLKEEEFEPIKERLEVILEQPAHSLEDK